MFYDEPVNTATWKTWRETLGMTAQQVAEELGVNLRTAQRWEATNDPPAFAVEWLDGYRLAMLDRIRTVVQDKGPVRLVRYRTEASARAAGEPLPLSMHAALIGLTAAALEESRREYVIDWDV